MAQPKATVQHEWIRQLIGTWTFESVCDGGPDSPEMKISGRETVRALGDYWIVAEASGDMPEGGEMLSVMTLGFDTQKGMFVGSWTGSPMTAMFVYEGELASDGVTLPLDTEGPGMMDPSVLTKYQDVMEIHPDGRRLLHSQMLGEDGAWVRFMTATYTRTGG
ncbi:MAG: hypothetical protein DHS20C14_11640 [Phycisphaeraceae bacterium]|nr:MAG: hypothetical protein DHS20C14_11640 [Phycisphaeraceae bacterium]